MGVYFSIIPEEFSHVAHTMDVELLTTTPQEKYHQDDYFQWRMAPFHVPLLYGSKIVHLPRVLQPSFVQINFLFPGIASLFCQSKE